MPPSLQYLPHPPRVPPVPPMYLCACLDMDRDPEDPVGMSLPLTLDIDQKYGSFKVDVFLVQKAAL